MIPKAPTGPSQLVCASWETSGEEVVSRDLPQDRGLLPTLLCKRANIHQNCIHKTKNSTPTAITPRPGTIP